MKKMADLIGKRPVIGWLIFIVTALIVYGLAMLAISIIERRTEARLQKQVFHPVARMETRNEKWGKNFPRQYERYAATAEGDFASLVGGNVMIDELERDPRLVVLWAGYAFSNDYNQGRGHYNSVEDVRNTLRTNPATVATCWACKSPDTVRIMDQIGPEAFYSGKWAELGHEIVNPIGCLDCHNPKDMSLAITRPALVEAFEREGKDIFKSTHQEMRSLVCAQCHVEYYFKGEGNTLTFPWDKGRDVEDMEAYFDEVNHTDWTHALSRARMLKAQHPDFEIWEKGIHVERGVSCADCHMPYRTEGGMKFTDHKIMSPLANIATSCQVCHRESEETLRHNVFSRQEVIRGLKRDAEENLVKAHIEAKTAWDAGATAAEMEEALVLIRHAQWRWDFAVASHGASFHAPLEVARILGGSIERAKEARLHLTRILYRYGVTEPVAMPDISTKEKAQEFIGVDREKLERAKEEFLRTVVPEWDAKARAREAIDASFQ